MRVLLTGAAGFIGSHVAEALVARGCEVIGIDNFDPYYDVTQKRRNVAELHAQPGAARFRLVEGSIEDRSLLHDVASAWRPEVIIHLAAIPGARGAVPSSSRFIEVNVRGTVELLELAREAGITRFVLASTAAVYGNSGPRPSREDDAADRSLTPHAGSKRAAELMAHSYHHLYGLNVSVLRLFTVYGPRNRPDMMAFQAIESILHGRPLSLFDGGRVLRDWTYVDDAVNGILAAAERVRGFQIFNLGHGSSVPVLDFVQRLEKAIGLQARRSSRPRPEFDPSATHADISRACSLLGYRPRVSLDDGVERLWQWYCLTQLLADRARGSDAPVPAAARR